MSGKQIIKKHLLLARCVCLCLSFSKNGSEEQPTYSPELHKAAANKKERNKGKGAREEQLSWKELIKLNQI